MGTWPSASRAGINRARWNLSFPSTEQARLDYREHLRRAVEYIQGSVDEEHDWEQLRDLERVQRNPPTDRILNDVRGELVRDFNEKAPGRPIFGEKIGPTDAGAGEYRVRLTVDGKTVEGSITVREDPLVSRNR